LARVDPAIRASRAVATTAVSHMPLTIGLGTVLIALQGLALYFQLSDRSAGILPIYLAQGAIWLSVCCAVLAGRLSIGLPVLLAVAFLWRLVVLFADPQFSTDIFRYIWDGRMQAAGINPYRYVPADEALAALRDPTIFARINRAEYATTIYPPAAQAFFLVVTRLGETVTVMKSAMVAMEALALWGVLRLLRDHGLPSDRAVVLAWSPLAVCEIAGSGHVDALMMALVVLAILACRWRFRSLAGGLLGIAVLTKFFPLAIVPALWRRWDWRLPAALVAVLVLGYLPYIGAGWAVLGFLPGYAGEEGIASGSGFWGLRVLRDLSGHAIPTSAYLATAALCLGGLALWVQFWSDDECMTDGPVTLAAAAMLALTPVYPWYFVWLLPLIAIARPNRNSIILLWLVAISPFLYLYDARMQQWQLDVVYGSTLGLAVIVFLSGRFPRHGRLASV
jgi:alpha-1,6-mannosyltransferase